MKKKRISKVVKDENKFLIITAIVLACILFADCVLNICFKFNNNTNNIVEPNQEFINSGYSIANISSIDDSYVLNEEWNYEDQSMTKFEFKNDITINLIDNKVYFEYNKEKLYVNMDNVKKMIVVPYDCGNYYLIGLLNNDGRIGIIKADFNNFDTNNIKDNLNTFVSSITLSNSSYKYTDIYAKTLENINVNGSYCGVNGKLAVLGLTRENNIYVVEEDTLLRNYYSYAYMLNPYSKITSIDYIESAMLVANTGNLVWNTYYLRTDVNNYNDIKYQGTILKYNKIYLNIIKTDDYDYSFEYLIIDRNNNAYILRNSFGNSSYEIKKISNNAVARVYSKGSNYNYTNIILEFSNGSHKEYSGNFISINEDN